MSEIEQLRKELRELRARIVALEAKTAHPPVGLMTFAPVTTGEPSPRFVSRDPLPPGTITC